MPAILLLVFGAAACSGSSDDDDIVEIRDSGPTPRDAGSRDAGPRDAGPRDGGVLPSVCDGKSRRGTLGYGGGSIAGELIVHVVSDTGAPIGGATVVMESASETEIIMTNNAGCAGFEIASGPVNVHVMASNYVFISQIDLDARQYDVELQPTTGVGQPVPAVISGPVVGLDQVLTTTTATLARAAVASSITRSVFGGGDLNPQPMRVGGRFGANIAVVGAGSNFVDYSLNVEPTAAIGVVATAGPVVLDGATVAYTPTHVGVLRGIAVTAGDNLTDQTLTISHRLDSEMVTVSYQPPPALPIQTVFGYLFLPNREGVVFMSSDQMPANNMGMVTMPTDDGVFAGSTFGAVVQVSDRAMGPTRLAFVVDPGTNGASLDVGAVPNPPQLATATGRTLRVALEASDITYTFLSSNAGTEWEIRTGARAAGNFEVTLPDVPAPLIDPASGMRAAFVQQRGYTNFDEAEFDYGDFFFDDNMRTYTFSNATVTF